MCSRRTNPGTMLLGLLIWPNYFYQCTILPDESRLYSWNYIIEITLLLSSVSVPRWLPICCIILLNIQMIRSINPAPRDLWPQGSQYRVIAKQRKGGDTIRKSPNRLYPLYRARVLKRKGDRKYTQTDSFKWLRGM